MKFTQQEKTKLREIKRQVSELKSNPKATADYFQNLFNCSRQFRMDMEEKGHNLINVDKCVGFSRAYKDFMLESGNGITLAEWTKHIVISS